MGIGRRRLPVLRGCGVTAGTASAPSGESQASSTFAPVTFACSCVVAGLCFVAYGFSTDAVVAALFAVLLLVLAAIDLRQRIIPNVIVLPGAAIVLLANIANQPSRTVEWLVAAAGAFAFFLAVALINPAGLGMGDVKLAFLVGAGLGWDVAGALLLGTFAAAVYAVFLVLTRPGTGAKTAFAFGPFLAGAAIVVLLLAH
jgi:leader peptidase (prepilin peptidase)/N-methyltransferase